MQDLDLGTDLDTGRSVTRQRELAFKGAYILGRTGAGKTSLMRVMNRQEVTGTYKREKGELPLPYAGYISEAGDACPAMVSSLPERVLPRVRFSSVQHPLAYNLLMRTRDVGKREEEFFALVDEATVQSSTTQPLTARQKRALSIILWQLKDRWFNIADVARYARENSYFVAEQMGMTPKDFTSIVLDSLLDRLSILLRSADVRRVFCQPQSMPHLDWNQVLDEGLLVYDWLGLADPFVARLLSSAKWIGLSRTLMEREESRRRPIVCALDEFQNAVSSQIAVEGFQRLLAQGRRYLCSLCVAHQDFGTIDRKLLHTLLGNVAMAVCYSCGPEESQTMSKLFGGKYKPEQLAFQEDFHCTLRLGTTVQRMETYEPPKKLREIHWEKWPWTGEEPPNPLLSHTSATEDDGMDWRLQRKKGK